MWYTILERLKSPVVIGQVILSAFALVSAVTGSDYTALADKIILVVTALFALFASVNNPTTKDKF